MHRAASVSGQPLSIAARHVELETNGGKRVTPPFEHSKGRGAGQMFILRLGSALKLTAPTAAVPCYPTAGCRS